MMKAILHIGTEKTGTKTLQELLFINKDLLAHYGVATLDSTGYKDDRKLATYCISDDRVDDHVKALNITDLHARSKWKNKFRRELDKNIKSLDGSVHTIIFTSEHFHSRLVAEEEVLTLSNLLKNYFDDFKVIVYLRRQDEVATSLYSTALRVGLFMKNVLPDPESQFSSRYYNYQCLLERWSKIFGRNSIIPRVFDSNKFVDKDLICDFLYFCDLNLNNDKLLRPSNENEALSASMQQVLLMFNLYSPWRHDNVIHRQVINLLIDKLSGSLTGIPTLPLRSEAINFCKAFASSNECVAKKWFNQDRLFNDDFSKYPEDLVSDSDLSAKLANVIPSCRDQNELVSQVTKIIIDRQRLTHLA